MKIERLDFTDFRAISHGEFVLDGKSTILFGANGTGKSSVLKGVNLLYANIINQIVNRKELKTLISMALDKEAIRQMYLDDQEEYWPFVNVIKWYVNSDRA